MRVISPIAIAAALLVLAGCAGTAGQGTAGESPSGETADTAPTAPFPTVELDCESLIDQSVIEAAFDPSTALVPLTFEGPGGYYELTQLGLEQSGALRCEWSDGDEVGSESYLQVSVMNDAADDWATYSSEIALFQPTADTYGDASWQMCRDGDYPYCRIDVLVGERWMSAVLGGLTSTDAAASVIEAAIASLSEAGNADEPWETTATGPDDCEQFTSATGVVGEMDFWDRDFVPTQPVMYHAGFLAAGGMFCSWRNSFSSSSALTTEIAVLPGGGWAWERYWSAEPSDRVNREAVDDLGDAAYAACLTDGPCYATVLVGDSWLAVTVNDESTADTRPVAIEVARAAVETL